MRITSIRLTTVFLVLLYSLLPGLLSAGSLPDFTDMVEKYSPSVVNISTSQSSAMQRANPHHKFQMPDLDENNPLNDLLKRFFGDQLDIPDLIERDAKSLGSGFIISSDGYILTNHHVVSSADEILVRLTDRREFRAELIGSDKASDIALIKIDATDLPTVTLGKAADLKVGEWVLAIGSPFGFDHSVTVGIVSAKGRNLPNENYVPFIQTDVAINPGNSGGPLFNLDGEVVGVNSQIYSRSGGFMGLSFSIPIELAMNVVEQLKTHGRVARGYLGVLIQDVTHELADSFNMKRPRGALIAKVLDDSPAGEAGLQVGDVILSFNGHTVEKSSQLPPLVGTSPINTPADVEILRAGKRQIIKVSVRQLPETEKVAQIETPAAKPKEDRIGLIVEELDERERQELGLDTDEGVVVTQIAPGAAKQAGIQSGDLIVMINNKKIKNKADYQRAIEQAKAGKNMAFLVNRSDAALFIAIRAPLDK